MRYLSVAEVVAINERLVGPGKLVDEALLAGAVGRPQQSVFGEDAYADVHAKAAALLHSLARNHCFLDGNKRTAYTAVDVFYRRNGIVPDLSADNAVTLTLAAATGEVDVDELAEHLRALVDAGGTAGR